SHDAPFAQEPSTQSPDSRQQRADTETPAEGEAVTLPEGAKIPVRVTDEINSKQGKEGEMFSGSVDPSAFVNDEVGIPRGTEAHMRMTHNKKGGHIHGKAEVTLELVSLILNGRRLEVESNEISKKKGALSAKGAAVAKKSPSGAMVAGEPVGAALP